MTALTADSALNTCVAAVCFMRNFTPKIGVYLRAKLRLLWFPRLYRTVANHADGGRFAHKLFGVARIARGMFFSAQRRQKCGILHAVTVFALLDIHPSLVVKRMRKPNVIVTITWPCKHKKQAKRQEQRAKH